LLLWRGVSVFGCSDVGFFAAKREVIFYWLW
jgi:hypothetical protein